VTPITQEAQGKADTGYMNKKHTTPVLDAVRRMHQEQDKLQGCDPYNTGRHPALLLHGPLPEQLDAARRILAATPEVLTCE
jgi:hypothetical protein